MAKRILCKVFDRLDQIIVYRNGTWRYQWEKIDSGNSNRRVSRWKLEFTESGEPMFFYDLEDGDWNTDWEPNDAAEIALANKIAEALADLEVEKMLRGKNDKA